MGGVEEQKSVSVHRKFNRRPLFTKIFSVILALALIGTSFHLATYATVVSTTIKSTELGWYPLYNNIPLNLNVDEAFKVNVTVAHDPNYGSGFGIGGAFQEWTWHIPRLESDLTGWDEATIWLDSIFNLSSLLTNYTYYEVPMTVWKNATQTNETITVIVQGKGTSTNPNYTTNPSNLEVEVYTPEGTTLTENFYRNEVNRLETSSSPPVAVTQPWTYTFKITNKGSWDWNGFLVIYLQFQHFEKPYFWWGIVGSIIAIGYIVMVTIMSNKTRHKNDE